MTGIRAKQGSLLLNLHTGPFDDLFSNHVLTSCLLHADPGVHMTETCPLEFWPRRGGGEVQVLKQHLPQKLFAVLQSASSCLMCTHWTDEEKMPPETAKAWLDASCDGAEGLVRKFRSQLRCEAAFSGLKARKAFDAHLCCSSVQLLKDLHGWSLELPSHGHVMLMSAAVYLACMQRHMDGSQQATQMM